MTNKKEYMKKYYQEHKQKMLETKKKWDLEHPDYQKKYYLKNKEQNYKNSKKWRDKNPRRFSELCQQSRRKKVEQLRSQGCTNAWCVVGKGAEPKFEK